MDYIQKLNDEVLIDLKILTTKICGQTPFPTICFEADTWTSSTSHIHLGYEYSFIDPVSYKRGQTSIGAFPWSTLIQDTPPSNYQRNKSAMINKKTNKLDAMLANMNLNDQNDVIIPLNVSLKPDKANYHDELKYVWYEVKDINNELKYVQILPNDSSALYKWCEYIMDLINFQCFISNKKPAHISSRYTNKVVVDGCMFIFIFLFDNADSH